MELRERLERDREREIERELGGKEGWMEGGERDFLFFFYVTMKE